LIITLEGMLINI